jgi:hypothetical protein
MKDFDKTRKKLLGRLETCSDFVRGSVTSVCAKCNRAGCVCGKITRRRAYRLTYKDGRQKTRIVYVPRSRLPKIKEMIANYARLRKLIGQIVETNIEAFKEGSRR